VVNKEDRVGRPMNEGERERERGGDRTDFPSSLLDIERPNLCCQFWGSGEGANMQDGRT
jgi:hypothetical protein